MFHTTLHYRLFLWICPVIFLGSCEKTSTITGTVMDSGSGQPVAGIKIDLYANHIGNKGTESVDRDSDISDSLGRYMVEVRGKKSRVDHILIKARTDRDYIEPAFRSFEIGECPTVDYVLNPLDAWLNLRIRNESGVSETFYYAVTGAMYEGRRYAGPGGSGPFSIPLFSTLEHTFRVPGGGFVQIIWGNNNFGSTGTPHLDSVFCARRDTTYHTLIY